MDSIQLTGLRAYGYTGVLPEEKKIGQWFEVELTLWMDLTLAGQSDRLSDTHDYVSLAQATQTLIQTATFDLIESLASAIAQKALDQDLRLTQVRVKLIKLRPPIPDFGGQVAIDITRARTPST